MDTQQPLPQEPSPQIPKEDETSPVKKEKMFNASLIKLISFYALIIGIIGTILFVGITLTKKQSNPSPTPTPTLTVTPTISSTHLKLQQTMKANFVAESQQFNVQMGLRANSPVATPMPVARV